MNFVDNLAQKIQRLLKLQGMKAESAGFDDEFGYAFCNILLKEACENDFKLDYCDVDKIWQKVLRSLNSSVISSSILGESQYAVPAEMVDFCKNYISVFFPGKEVVVVDPIIGEGRVVSEIIQNFPKARGVTYTNHPLWTHILNRIDSRIQVLKKEGFDIDYLESRFDILLPCSEALWTSDTDQIQNKVLRLTELMQNESIIISYESRYTFQQSFEATPYKILAEHGIGILYIFGSPKDYGYFVVVGKTNDPFFTFSPSIKLLTPTLLNQTKNGKWDELLNEGVVRTSWENFFSASYCSKLGTLKKKGIGGGIAKEITGKQLIQTEYSYSSSGNNFSDELSNYIYLPRTAGLMDKIGIVGKIPSLDDPRLSLLKMKDLPYKEFAWYHYLLKNQLLSDKNMDFLLEKNAFVPWNLYSSDADNDGEKESDESGTDEGSEQSYEEPDAEEFWTILKRANNILHALEGSFRVERYYDFQESVLQDLAKRTNWNLEYDYSDPEKEKLLVHSFFLDMFSTGFTQVELKPGYVISSYFLELWNSNLGNLYRENFMEKIKEGKSVADTFRENVFFLPNVDHQTQTVEETVKIASEIARLQEMKKKIVEKDFQRNDIMINYSALPYPLASILYMLECETENSKKVDILLHFFEATAMFHAVILASGMLRYCQTVEQKTLWKEENPIRWIGPKQKSGFYEYKPDFGTWTYVLKKLGPKISSELSNITNLGNHKRNRDEMIEAYGEIGAGFLINILSKAHDNAIKVASKISDEVSKDKSAVSESTQFDGCLEKAKEIRNAKSHGGYTTKSKHQERYANLYKELDKLLPILYKAYADVDVIIKNDDRSIKLAMGIHPQLRTIQYAGSEAGKISEIQTETIVLRNRISGEVLPLLPLVRPAVMAEDGEYLAIYFLNQFVFDIQSGEFDHMEGKWVAYQCSCKCEIDNSNMEPEPDSRNIAETLWKLKELSVGKEMKKR